MERLKPMLDWRRDHSERIWSAVMTSNMMFWLLQSWPSLNWGLRAGALVVFPYAAAWLWQHARLLDSIKVFQRKAAIVGPDIAAATLAANMTRIYLKQFTK